MKTILLTFYFLFSQPVIVHDFTRDTSYQIPQEIQPVGTMEPWSDELIMEVLGYESEMKFHLEYKLGIDVDLLSETISKIESGGNYFAENQFGYFGKYQFGYRTLMGLYENGLLDYKDIWDYYLEPEIQEKAFLALLYHNYQILDRYGLIVEGANIESLLAGAHHLGPAAVRHFVKTKSLSDVYDGRGNLIRKVDGNGYSISTYMAHLS